MPEQTQQSDTTAPPLLQVRGLDMFYGKPLSRWGRLLKRPNRRLRALDGIDLVVRRGQTVAVVGETGSGKSTLGRLVVRLEHPAGGDIEVDGTSVLRAPAPRASGCAAGSRSSCRTRTRP